MTGIDDGFTEKSPIRFPIFPFPQPESGINMRESKKNPYPMVDAGRAVTRMENAVYGVTYDAAMSIDGYNELYLAK